MCLQEGRGGARQEGIFQRQPFMPLSHMTTPSRPRHERNQAPRDRRSHARLPKSGRLAGSLSAVRTGQPQGLLPDLHGPWGSAGQGGDGRARPRPASGVPRPGARTR